jgi:hypothetical protein
MSRPSHFQIASASRGYSTSETHELAHEAWKGRGGLPGCPMTRATKSCLRSVGAGLEREDLFALAASAIRAAHLDEESATQFVGPELLIECRDGRNGRGGGSVLNWVEEGPQEKGCDERHQDESDIHRKVAVHSSEVARFRRGVNFHLIWSSGDLAGVDGQTSKDQG